MRRLFFAYILLLCSVLAWSQSPSVAYGLPYECSFEESEDLSAWTFNEQTSAATDQWIVGTAVHSDGKRSLYVSTDGSSPGFGKNPNIVVSYLRYKFPTETNTQKYDISFDWRGVGDSTTSKLYVMVCPETWFTSNPNNNPRYIGNIVSTTNGRLSNATVNVCEQLGESGEKFVCGSETWQNVSLTREVSINATNSQQNFALVFIWVNDNRVDSLGKSAIAIDNVQINSAAIKKPTNLDVVAECDSSWLVVSWESGLQEFDIEYRSVGATSWRRASGLTDGMEGFTRTDGTKCSYIIKRIPEGSYDVRVRGVSDDLRTGFVYKNLILVYCPDNHCINYVDLYDKTRVLCQYGYHPGAQAGASPYDSIGIIDFGPDAEESRHTLHVDPTELDPRTDSMLYTVPNGALASVRLGNWKWGGEAEAITYDILVDTTTQGILIVKYAVVFENPDGHPVEDEPAFKLEIMKPDGSIIDDLCGQASFTYSSSVNDPEHWHLTKDGNVAWKDWTTVGVSLMQYHGQNIKVRFTTLDCGWSGHFAYAYFTVDCANAHIETENCGNDAKLTCKAPDGFSYEWSDETGLVVGNEQELSVDAGRHTYTCRVSFIEEPSCYFEISTLSAPRFPVPEYTFDRLYGECSSKLKFTNTSHVMNKFEGYENHTSEPCSDFHWEFRRISNNQVKMTDAQSPVYTCPPEGDSIEVKYTCYIGVDNSCDSTRIDTIVVPSIISVPTEFRYTTCSESPVQFGDEWFNTDTVYTKTFPNYAGCDSTSTLYLKVYPKPEDLYRHDSICSNQSLTINGVKYTQPLEDYQIHLKNQHGCDSVIHLTLTVNQLLHATVDTFAYSCADDGQMFVLFDIAEGVFDSLVIEFSTPLLRDTVIYDSSVSSVAIPYATDIMPGHYFATMTFHQFCCGPYTQTRGFDIRYSSSVVEQKWNDVLTLLSPKYNGGYEFLSYQWYKNGEPLAGETHSYLYQPLDFDAEYYVELMRADSVVMTTCPIQPVYHEQQSAYPTIVPAGQQMPMYMQQAATIWYYTVAGQLYGSFTLPQGYTSLPVPAQTGVFVLKSVSANGDTQAQVMIVE